MEQKDKRKVYIEFHDTELDFVNDFCYTRKSNQKWIQWGKNDNFFPERMIELYRTAPNHGTLLKRKAKLVAGDGLVISETNPQLKKWIDDVFVDDPNEFIKQIGEDYLLFNGFAAQTNISFNGEAVTLIKYIDFSKLRIGKTHKDKIESFYLSNNWCNTRWNEPVEYFAYGSTGSTFESIAYKIEPAKGGCWYPEPEYFQGIKAVEDDRNIATMRNAYIENGFNAGHLITIYEDPTEEERKQITSNTIKSFTSPKNANKFIIAYALDKDHKMEIDPLNGADMTANYEHLEEQTKQTLLSIHGIDAPELLSIPSPGASLGGDSNKVLLAYKMLQANIIKPIQRKIEKFIIDLAKKSGIVVNDGDLFISNSIPVTKDDNLAEILFINERRELQGHEPKEGLDVIGGTNISVTTNSPNPDVAQNAAINKSINDSFNKNK